MLGACLASAISWPASSAARLGKASPSPNCLTAVQVAVIRGQAPAAAASAPGNGANGAAALADNKGSKEAQKEEAKEKVAA